MNHFVLLNIMEKLDKYPKLQMTLLNFSRFPFISILYLWKGAFKSIDLYKKSKESSSSYLYSVKEHWAWKALRENFSHIETK